MHRAVTIARDLIAIPSVNPMGKGVSGEIYFEKQVASYVCNFLRSRGVDVTVEGVEPDRPNVIARIDAGKPETVLLEAHMDTVSHENMSIAPFDPKIENGLLYGRGSCDTKSALATYLYAVERMLQEGYSWKRNLILAAVHDEEYSFGGSRQLARMDLKVTFAIAGEPTSLHIIYAHKGVCRFMLSTHGKSAHGALPWLGESAIHKMGRVIIQLESYAQRLGAKVHPELGPATLNIGRIFGGETVNTVPSLCTIEIDHRLLPGENYHSVHAALAQSLENVEGWRISPPYLQAPGVYVDKNSLSCRELICACRATDWTPELRTAHYATDAAILNEAGIPTIVFGPGKVELAHTAAEHISLSEIENAAEIILVLLREE
jgi:acetylornithine deacetylase